LLLVTLYAALVLFNPFSSLAIATLALIEPFIAMRKPFNGGRSSKDPPADD